MHVLCKYTVFCPREEERLVYSISGFHACGGGGGGDRGGCFFNDPVLVASSGPLWDSNLPSADFHMKWFVELIFRSEVGV